MPKIRYINIAARDGNPIETVDEFPYDTKEERKEFSRCLGEYRFGDTYNSYYSSQKATKEWRNKE